MGPKALFSITQDVQYRKENLHGTSMYTVYRIILIHIVLSVSSLYAVTPHELARNNDFVRLATYIHTNPSAVHTRNSKGRIPLHEAASNGHCETTRILIQCGSHLDAQDNDYATPLMLSITYNRDTKKMVGNTIYIFGYHDTVIKLLLIHGTNPNIQNADGNTPLHVVTKGSALPYGYIADQNATSSLLQFCADPNITNAHGVTPWDHLWEYNTPYLHTRYIFFTVLPHLAHGNIISFITKTKNFMYHIHYHSQLHGIHPAKEESIQKQAIIHRIQEDIKHNGKIAIGQQYMKAFTTLLRNGWTLPETGKSLLLHALIIYAGHPEHRETIYHLFHTFVLRECTYSHIRTIIALYMSNTYPEQHVVYNEIASPLCTKAKCLHTFTKTLLRTQRHNTANHKEHNNKPPFSDITVYVRE